MCPIRKRSHPRSGIRLKTLLIVMTTLSVLAFSALVVTVSLHLIRHRTHVSILSSPQPPQHNKVPRTVYPYSIVPGGVYGPEDVAQAIRRLPLARDHYKEINSENLVSVRMPRPLRAFVSYRKNGRIFWTKHQVQIARGELVLTDGKHMIRGRCGNRIEEHQPPNAVLSTGNQEEPQEWEFDIPGVPALREEATLPPIPPFPGSLAHPETNVLFATPEPSAAILLFSGVAPLILLSLARARIRKAEARSAKAAEN